MYARVDVGTISKLRLAAVSKWHDEILEQKSQPQPARMGTDFVTGSCEYMIAIEVTQCWNRFPESNQWHLGGHLFLCISSLLLFVIVRLFIIYFCCDLGGHPLDGVRGVVGDLLVQHGRLGDERPCCVSSMIINIILNHTIIGIIGHSYHYC